MTDLIDTTEMYLRTVYELEEEGVVPLRARIAERLGHSGPTVSQTVGRLERDGLMVVRGDRHLELTDAGRARATRVMRKHRLAERLLTDVIGLEWERVHVEACRWEHVMSEEVERRLIQVLGDPALSPYGGPIPARAEIGGDGQELGFLDGVTPLSDLAGDRPGTGEAAGGAEAGGAAGAPAGSVTVTVARLGESVQNDPALMAALAAVGALPGRRLDALPVAGGWRLTVPGGTASADVTDDQARSLFVERAGLEQVRLREDVAAREQAAA
jgi:DtxR family Mn-dependent transcriptional regulator